MSDDVSGVIVSHRSLALALLDTVECIIGPEHGLTSVSNDGCGTESLFDRIANAVEAEPTIIFVDMPGGSCFMAAARFARNRDDVALVAGVNLPMLLEFVNNRNENLEVVVDRLVACGAKSIRAFPT